MGKKIMYRKSTPRINVKFINGDNNELLMEIPNRTSMDINEIFSDDFITKLMMKNEVNCDNIRVLVLVDYFKN